MMIQTNDKERLKNMKNLKRISAALIAFIMLLSFAGCGGDADDETTTEAAVTEIATSYIRNEKTKIAALNGTIGLGISKFSVDRAYNYETSYYDDVQEAAELLKSGSADIATLPVDEAAKLYNETNGAVQLLAVNGLGFYHVIENGEKIKSISDLKGKTVYAAYKGTGAEMAINYLFEKNGIDPEKDIDIQFKVTDTEVANLTNDASAEIIIVPEPHASKVLNNTETYRKALSINSEWDKVCETPMTRSVIVARTEYINANPDIIKEFISYNKISVNYLKGNTYGAPVFLKENGFSETATLATEFIPGCNLSFLSGEEMKIAVGAMLENVYKISVDDAFYYGI